MDKVFIPAVLAVMGKNLEPAASTGIKGVVKACCSSCRAR